MTSSGCLVLVSRSWAKVLGMVTSCLLTSQHAFAIDIGNRFITHDTNKGIYHGQGNPVERFE